MTPAGALVPVFTLDRGDGLVSPVDLAVDPSGRLLVLDAAGPDLVVFGSDGRALDRWTVSGAGNRSFFRPTTVAISGLAILLMDPAERLVLRFDMRGQYQGIALDLDADRSLDGEGFFEPSGLTADHTGQLYVSDREGHRVLVFDSASRFLLAFGGFGSGEGRLRDPGRLAVDDSGILYVLDAGNRRIQRFDVFGTPLGSSVVTVDDGASITPRDIAVLSGDVVLAVADGGRLIAQTPQGRPLFRYRMDGLSDVAAQPSRRIYLLARDQARIEALDVEAR